MSVVTAPWTPEQVEALKVAQVKFHPFTCADLDFIPPGKISEFSTDALIHELETRGNVEVAVSYLVAKTVDLT